MKRMLTKVVIGEIVLLTGVILSFCLEMVVGMQNAGFFGLFTIIQLSAAVGVGLWAAQKWKSLKDKSFQIMVRHPGISPEEYMQEIEVDNIWTAREEAERLYALCPDAIIWDRESFSVVPIQVSALSTCEPPSRIKVKHED